MDGAVNGDNGSDSSRGAGATRRRDGVRADARRNRARLLAAATDAFVELGSGVALEEIARRAGVGIATLYRGFPDRSALARAVVLDILARSRDAAEAAGAETSGSDGDRAFEALASYMHAAIELRISAVVPALLALLPRDDHALAEARSGAAAALERLIERARAAGALRPDVEFTDIGTSLVRLSRPLPGAVAPDLDVALAHRQLDLLLDGLRNAAGNRELAGPALRLDEFRTRLAEDAASRASGVVGPVAPAGGRPSPTPPPPQAARRMPRARRA